jgi:hypothetical protein
MIKPNREKVIAAITEWNAAVSIAERKELDLSRILRAAGGRDGTIYGRWWLRPTADGGVRTQWLEAYPAKPAEPELDMGKD